MDTTIAVPRLELLQVADAVAREKGIERDEVLEAMEQAIQKAGRSKYGPEHDIRAAYRPQDRRDPPDALSRGGRDRGERGDAAHAEAGAARSSRASSSASILIDELPPIDFGRIAAQTAKQVIVQKVREAERKRQFDEYKDRMGEIVNGLVKRVEFGNVTVDLGRAEGLLRRDELLPREIPPQRRPRARLHLRRARGSRAARRFSCRAPIRISWPSCSPRKCRKSTTASSRSRRWPAIPAAAPRSP